MYFCDYFVIDLLVVYNGPLTIYTQLRVKHISVLIAKDAIKWQSVISISSCNVGLE